MAPAARRLRIRADLLHQRARPQLSLRRTIARELAAALGTSCRALVPLDPLAIANQMGVTEFRLKPLTIRGQLRVLAGGRMALDVNQDLAAYEQHFTIAHEVGHLILERRRIRTALLLGRPSCPAPTQKASDDRLEMMCDFLAEELLIPESWLASKAATYGEPDLTLAIDIASYANVSLFLVIRRLIEMGHLGKQAILWARDNDGTLHATASYPGRDDLTLLGLRVLSDIHKTNPSSSSTLQGTIKILALGEPFEYPFEGVETDSQSIITVLK